MPYTKKPMPKFHFLNQVKIQNLWEPCKWSWIRAWTSMFHYLFLPIVIPWFLRFFIIKHTVDAFTNEDEKVRFIGLFASTFCCGFSFISWYDPKYLGGHPLYKAWPIAVDSLRFSSCWKKLKNRKLRWWDYFADCSVCYSLFDLVPWRHFWALLFVLEAVGFQEEARWFHSSTIRSLSRNKLSRCKLSRCKLSTSTAFSK